jgi:uncharacterized membrane protein YphA (DoxX/SURF4 family)
VETVAYAARFFLALVFLVVGAVKISQPDEFERAVTNYRLLPRRFSRPVALWLPRAELAAGVLLALGVALVPVSCLLALLLLVFSGAVAVNLLRGREIDCGCFGSSTPQKMTWLTVGRNLALMAMALSVALSPPSALSLWPGPGAGGEATVGPGTALAMLIASTSLVALLGLLGEARRVAKSMRQLERRTLERGGTR